MARCSSSPFMIWARMSLCYYGMKYTPIYKHLNVKSYFFVLCFREQFHPLGTLFRILFPAVQLACQLFTKGFKKQYIKTHPDWNNPLTVLTPTSPDQAGPNIPLPHPNSKGVPDSSDSYIYIYIFDWTALETSRMTCSRVMRWQDRISSNCGFRSLPSSNHF